jgi:serine/threonine-protein kinase RsbW
MKKNRLVVHSKIEVLDEVYSWLKQILETAEYQEFNQDNILLVSHEMVANAILHGNREDATKNVWIILEKIGKEIFLFIKDEGTHNVTFPSKEASKELDYLAENGRGLKLAVLLSDSIKYKNNYIEIIFKKQSLRLE